MAVMDPPLNPLSLPQSSRIYCEIMRSGSIAWARHVKHRKTRPMIQLPIAKDRHDFVLLLWEILESLNNDLILFLQRTFVAGDNVKQKLKSLLSRRRYPRTKHMFEDDRCTCMN